MAGYKSWLPEYEFNHKYRGLALVFVQEFFDDTRFSTRKGASKDVKKMRELFEKLDFKVKVYKDLNRVQIMEKLEKARNCKYNKESDCFACVISTHGEEMAEKDRKLQMTRWKNTVFGKDCQSIFVDEILDMFSNKKCEGLKDKPKLFFIQACRSRHPASQDHLLYDWGGMVQIKEKKESKDYPDSSGGGDGSWSHDSLDVVKHHEKGSEQDKQLEKLEEKFIKTGIQEQGEGDEFKDVKDCVNIYEDWEEDEDEDEFQSNQDEDKEVEEEEEQIPVDELEAGGQTDSGNVPQGPQELTPINCPDDCLVLYPVMPGRVAFSSGNKGSWMLHFMHQNLSYLLEQNFRLFPYLTRVCADMAKKNFRPANLNEGVIFQHELTETKVAANIEHRLSKDVRLSPKMHNTLMGLWFKYLYPKLHEKFPL